jgi:hypothetical protein
MYHIEPHERDAANLANIARENAKRNIRRYTGQELKGRDLGRQLGLDWL